MKNYNNTYYTNPSNFVDEATNYIPRKIELIDIDKAIFDLFNNKFIINSKSVSLIKLDSEYTSKKIENFENIDFKDFSIIKPYFVYSRMDTLKKTKSSPTNKTVIYSVKKQKENGIVIEDWIMPPPFRVELQYQFNFYTSYRGVSNKFIEQFLELFKNKRIVLDVDGERFEIKPDDYENIVKLNKENGDDIAKKLIYNHEIILIVEGYLRLGDIKKKERINKFKLEIKERSVRIDGPYNIYL